jgi:PAS domain S-box-containing protein
MTDRGSRTPARVAEIGAIPAAIHRAALEHASEFFTLSDPTGELLWVSPAVVAVLGYNPDEFVAASAWSLLHPDDVERVRRIAAELAGDLGGRRRVQYRARHADDSWRWIEAVSSNLLDRPGVEGIVTTLRDVTSRVMAKRRLFQSERRLRSIVSSAGDVIAILDERGGIDYVTPTVATLLQRSATAIQDDWASYVHPDDAEEMFALFRVALDDPGVTKGPIDMRLLKGDGQWLTVETLFTDYRTDPIVRGIVLNARDVSERRQVEASERANQKIFNALVEMAPVGIFLTDPSGEWTYVNARIGADFGFEPGDLLGTGWMQLFDAADVVRLRSELARWDGLGRYVTELRTRTSPDARELRLTLSRPQSDGDQLGAVGTLEDVTSRRGLEEMLLDGAALGSVAGVVGSAAHDLHNLLASIGFQLGVLDLADDAGDRVDAANEAIDRACDRARNPESETTNLSDPWPSYTRISSKLLAIPRWSASIKSPTGSKPIFT